MGASGVGGGERGRKGTVWHKIAVHGIVWCCMIMHGITWSISYGTKRGVTQINVHGIVWYCMVQCNLLYGIAWYHVVLWCCKWKGEGESVTHSQVNEQWHYSAWQPGKMHSGLILLLILSNSWNPPQHGKEWDRLSRSIEVWGFSDALNTWLNTYILLLTPFQKRKSWTAIVITFLSRYATFIREKLDFS